ncbi:carboxypeptidase-like regulatory domain-containing protein [Myxococcus sp. K15C18031901]|uniref:carboxypeptidase-like regulatory domain-containing protein n=1 Tax=Myxococcus dinghuensis TaxID=2906761 RepID=UPI0020A8077E|nr:carboxypeptidase-like regulatory domain-containing protein [Myxococcus dinghuensis]MCP3097461.1 carboxypeptidase-like regulatory domain-containing protein [Myxococcus dinghuensis]
MERECRLAGTATRGKVWLGRGVALLAWAWVSGCQAPEVGARAARDAATPTAPASSQADAAIATAPRAPALRGVVKDALTGAALRGARVSWVEASQFYLVDARDWESAFKGEGAVVTDGEGRFEIPAGVMSSKALVVTHPTYVPVEVTEFAPDAPVQVALQPGATVRGTVRGVPSRGLQLVLRNEDSRLTYEEGLIPVKEGGFEKVGVPPGNYVASVDGTSDAFATPDIPSQYLQLTPGETVTLDFKTWALLGVKKDGARLRVRCDNPAWRVPSLVLLPGRAPTPLDDSAYWKASYMSLRSNPPDPNSKAEVEGRVETFGPLLPGPYTLFVIDLDEGTLVAVQRADLKIPKRGVVEHIVRDDWLTPSQLAGDAGTRAE